MAAPGSGLGPAARRGSRRCVGRGLDSGRVAPYATSFVAALVLFSTCSSAGLARPAGSFAGAYWVPSSLRSNDGCSQAHGYPGHWSASSGAGGFRAGASARLCPAYRGGSQTPSDAIASQEIEVVAPVVLPAGTGGINVSWNLNVLGNASASFSPRWPCPALPNGGSGNDDLGYTWLNWSYSTAVCEVQGTAWLGADTYLHDLTTGVLYYPLGGWYGVSVEFYNLTESLHYSGTYSNASFWAYNYSSWWNWTGSSGTWTVSPNGTVASGSGSISGTYHPVWYINGSFNGSDSYVVDTIVFGTLEATAEGWPGASGSATLVASGPTHHFDLAPFTIW